MGLAKAVVILATILSIATVSCGVNLALALRLSSQATLNAFIVAGWVEPAAMVSSVAGLIVVLVAWAVSRGRGATRKDTND